MSTATEAPPAAISAELRALVDAKVITLEQAQEAARSVPAADEFGGFARCVTQTCESFDALRPLRLRRTFMRTYGAAPLQHMVLQQTEYLETATPDEHACPDCAQPCALLPDLPPEIPAHGFG